VEEKRELILIFVTKNGRDKYMCPLLLISLLERRVVDLNLKQYIDTNCGHLDWNFEEYGFWMWHSSYRWKHDVLP